MPNPARRTIALAALAAAIIAGAVALDLAPAAAQSDDETGRIVAQRLADGRTEFGWQPAGAARVLPHARYFPANAQVGRWLNSSPVEVGGAEIGRINARLRSDGRIEFGFTPTDGERILPQSRYFPVDARAGRWLRSTTIDISAQTTPPPPVSSTGFSAVAAGGGHGCAIRTTGAIECWGSNYGKRASPPAGSFSAVAAGGGHSCAIRAGSGAIECWGRNYDGQASPPAGSFSAVAAGGGHSCAIRAGSGAIECWGWTYVEPTGSFSAVAAGHNYACAIRTGTGAIECWGKNWYGQLNDIPAGSFSAVSAGSHHNCAIRTTGAIECWGRNNDGQSSAPAGRFTAVSAGYRHTCAISESGAIECWGSNRRGQSSPPAGSFSAVAAGGYRTCAIRAGSGAIECWGRNWRGESTPPAGRFSAVAGYGEKGCGLREDGAIVCWGMSSTTNGSHITPPGWFRAVLSSYCGLRTEGWIECWLSDGRYIEGQTTAPRGKTSYTAVSGSCAIRADNGAIECWNEGATPPTGRFTAIAGSCAIRDDGAIQCWSGALRSDIPTGSFSAVSIPSYKYAKKYACAIRAGSGAITCWGDDSDKVVSDAPTGSGWSAIHAAGDGVDSTACAIRSDGAIVCWGGYDLIIAAR